MAGAAQIRVLPSETVTMDGDENENVMMLVIVVITFDRRHGRGPEPILIP